MAICILHDCCRRKIVDDNDDDDDDMRNMTKWHADGMTRNCLKEGSHWISLFTRIVDT